MNDTQKRAERLSHELQEGRAPSLRRRRRVAGLSLVAAGSMGVIALYQFGLIKHLPELPLPLLDADKVDASAEAYSKLRTPDAFLGLGSYAATAALAAMGGENRAREAPLIPLALAAKVGFDTFQGVRLTIDQWTKHGAFCSWCLLSASATFATVPLVIPETRAALREIFGAG